MKKQVFIRIISFMLLIAYMLAVVFTALKNYTPAEAGSLQYKGLRAVGFLKDGAYTAYINEYVDYLLLFIPVGFLFPFICGRKSLNGALILTVFSVAGLEFIRFRYTGGIIAIDDEIWALAGACIGSGFYSPVCIITGFGNDREEYVEASVPRWLGFAILFALTVFCLKTMSEENMSLSGLFSFDQETDEKFSEEEAYIEEAPIPPARTSEVTEIKEGADASIYDRLYTELSVYKSSVVFTDDSLIPQDIFDEFIKLLNDHPELFWLTGGAEVETVTYDDDLTLTFKPEFAASDEPVPDMSKALDHAVNVCIAECPGDGSDYDKALFIHDLIINNTKYDADVLFYAQDKDNPHFDQAYTAYGALVNHKAVCAGYARAYQLIMNRMGIECGYISGSAVNSKGETETHAWNYIKADGQYYFVDVTWDDPVAEDHTDTDHISHDYFFLSSADMGRDHFPEENQFIPYCPETRSPY